jgi:hypothetical protein
MAVLVAAASVVILTGCVPRPAHPGTPAPTAGSGPSTRIEAGGSAPENPFGPTPIPSFRRPTPAPAPTFLAYMVQRGDSLTSIARQFRTTPRSIAFWSRGEYPSLDPESAAYRPDRLEVGWLLLVIPDTVFDEDELTDTTPSPSPVATPS